jgi:hypothetical protein
LPELCNHPILTSSSELLRTQGYAPCFSVSYQWLSGDLSEANSVWASLNAHWIAEIVCLPWGLAVEKGKVIDIGDGVGFQSNGPWEEDNGGVLCS